MHKIVGQCTAEGVKYIHEHVIECNKVSGVNVHWDTWKINSGKNMV